MTRASTRTRRAAALVAMSALVAFEAAIANHFILPCREDCTTPRWVRTGSLATGRSMHTATLLPSGKVLVAGGRHAEFLAGGWVLDSRTLDSAELYDTATGSWSPAGHMRMPRVGHSATLLPDGRVLVAGGYYLDTIDSAELYDADTGRCSPTGSLNDGRHWHTMTLLQGGTILAARGSAQGDLWYNLTSAELYDSIGETWDVVPDSTLSSVFHTATLLPDGRVLSAGGYGGGDAKGVVNASCELFDPVTLARARGGDLLQRRYDHAATLLPGGHVLIAGGTELIGTVGNLRYKSPASAERFDPKTATWSSAGALNFARTSHTMTLLPDGSVLVVGGYSMEPGGVTQSLASAERYVVPARAAATVGPQRGRRPDDPVRTSRDFAPLPP